MMYCAKNRHKQSSVETTNALLVANGEKFFLHKNFTKNDQSKFDSFVQQ